MSEQLVPHDAFPDVFTGEVLPATPENAHRALAAVREMESRLRMVKTAVLDYLIEESRRQGTKTFNVPGGKVTLSGGTKTEIDAQTLAQLLRDADCPEERINEVVKTEITYKVDRSILRQLVAANPDYKAAADLATHEVETPHRANVS